MEKIMFTVKEIAEYLSSSESAVRKLIRESKIPYFRLNKKILFEKDFIDSWLWKNQILSINIEGNDLIVKRYEQDCEEVDNHEMGSNILRRTRNNNKY